MGDMNIINLPRYYVLHNKYAHKQSNHHLWDAIVNHKRRVNHGITKAGGKIYLQWEQWLHSDQQPVANSSITTSTEQLHTCNPLKDSSLKRRNSPHLLNSWAKLQGAFLALITTKPVRKLHVCAFKNSPI